MGDVCSRQPTPIPTRSAGKLCANVFAFDHLFADDAPVSVLNPGRGKTKTGRSRIFSTSAVSWTSMVMPGSSASPHAVM